MPSTTVDQAKLVLNAFAAIFQNNLVSTDCVTWKQYDGEMNDRDKLTVVEQVVPRYVVTQTANAVQDLTSGVQDTVFGSEQYTIDQIFGTSMGWADFVRVRDIGDARESEAIKSAALRLAEAIDVYILGTLALASDNWTYNTPGAAVATFNDVAAGYTRLKNEGVEDGDMFAVMTYDDKQSLGNTIVYPTSANSGVGNGNLSGLGDGVYRKGWEGEIAGIRTMFSQQLPKLQLGTRTNGTMNGGSQTVHYSAVSVSGAPGQYMTQTISVTGLGANATVNDGEVFTLTTSGGAPVLAYDNRAQQPKDYNQQFRVIGSYTASGAGAITNLRIFPALIIPQPGTITGDAAADTANATINIDPGAAAVVTWVGTASSLVRPRFIGQKSAVVVNTADLIMPATGIGSRKSLSKVPISVRMWQNSNFNTGEHDVRFDVALRANVKAGGRQRVVRING